MEGIALEHDVADGDDLGFLRVDDVLRDEWQDPTLHLVVNLLLLRLATGLELVPWLVATDQTEEDMSHGEDVHLLRQMLLAPRLLRRSPLRIRVLRWEAAWFLRRRVPSADDANVEIVQFERATDADDVGRVDVEMHEGWVFVAVNAVHISESVRDIARNLEPFQRYLLGLVGQLPHAGSISEFSHDGVPAETKDVNHVVR
mmetsp:Transcript_7673/g.20765  ORF Transcript_7673/g.20765 Transcript_7673/m.20765 type:complete len:201 (-) Transcript_7673:134-736(-)